MITQVSLQDQLVAVSLRKLVRSRIKARFCQVSQLSSRLSHQVSTLVLLPIDWVMCLPL